MTIREFEVLTGFHPSAALYEVIEQDYNSSQLDKHEYCDAYKADKDGIAERLAQQRFLDYVKNLKITLPIELINESDIKWEE